MSKTFGTVWVVEDEEETRRWICVSLARLGLDVESFVAPESFLENFDHSRPGCLIIDYCLPGKNGAELYAELQSQGIAIPAIFISGVARIRDVAKVMRLGALDFLEKPLSMDLLFEKVRLALKADQRIRIDGTQYISVRDRLASLTPREKEIMDLVVDGLPSKTIARRLDISHKTVEVHRSNITKRMNVRCVAELVKLVTEYRVRMQASPRTQHCFEDANLSANFVQN